VIELVFELIFEFFGELILQLVAEIFVDASSRGVKKTLRRTEPVDPMLAACGYVGFGWLAGMLSLWLVPDVFIKAHWLRVAGLLLLPLASGLVMSWIGSWRRRHDKDVSRIETFSYGFCFAFAMSLARFIWGNAG
jgi:hypothetical protein